MSYGLRSRNFSQSLYCAIIFILIASLLTAFIYFVALVDDLKHKTQLIASLEQENQISSRLAKLEISLKHNEEVKQTIKSQLDSVMRDVKELNETKTKQIQAINVSNKKRNKTITTFSKNPIKGGKFDISLADIYDELPFDNPDGGAWRQGWDIKLNTTRISTEKLKIFVVPHSHNDPGWLKTFDRYFREQTQTILNNAVLKLADNPDLTFIWAETSYLAEWWQSSATSDQLKDKLKRLLKSGQFEIVSGGWVMNDEANSHYSAIIGQMVEGHEWLRTHLDYRPSYGWAIDPFGLSPTMAYLNKKFGLNGMVVQRVHYSVKKHLASRRLLEFRWRQRFERFECDRDIVCHVEPFYSYDVPHTCGPDPKICCQFDFKRLPGVSNLRCPWIEQPIVITDNNVEERALLLLGQYRKKAELFKTRSLLIPLGDDFRYDSMAEWDAQVDNYRKLFAYINSHPDLNAEIKFGTLKNYFSSLPTVDSFPTLSGDFFTYSDRDDHYWSGYYTSRPFFKRFERVLESHLRSAEIIYSLSLVLNRNSSADLKSLSPELVYARQNLALFQHHDGITGTAKDLVVNDYANRMFQSMVNLERIMSASMWELLRYESGDKFGLKSLETIASADSLPIKKLFTIDDRNPIWYFIVYNSLGFDRTELICVHVSANASQLCIKDSKNTVIEDIQVNYVWSMHELMADRREVCLMADLKALSLVRYSIGVCGEKSMTVEPNEVVLYNFKESLPKPIKSATVTPPEIAVGNENVKMIISGADGMLRKVTVLEKSMDLRISFMTYGTRSGGSQSGAYLFLPDKQSAESLAYSRPKIRVTRGAIFSRFEAIINSPIPIRHQITVFKGKSYFEIENEFDANREPFGNKELTMRFETGIENGDVFHTDLNGFQTTRRQRYEKIPLQANVYPVSAMMCIEDWETRLSVLTGQPLGGTSPRSGWLDVFLDRRLLQDDQRGLGQGVTDNRRTKEVFKIMVDSLPSQPSRPKPSAENELRTLLSAPIVMYGAMKSEINEMYFLRNPLPCDVHLLSARSGPTGDEFDLFLQRFGADRESKCARNASAVKLTNHLSTEILGSLQTNISEMSLSLMRELKSEVSIGDELAIDEMAFAVYRLRKKL